jgi:transcriptional regulator with XRE-family HTH domain
MVRDFIEILSKCVASLGGVLFGVMLLALALGVLCWVACSYYTRLWHKRFHVRAQHHLLCAIAAILTVAFTVLFRAVGELEYIVNEIIDDWSEMLAYDNEWNSETYTLAFYTVKEKYPAEFRGVPEPGKADSHIPYNNDDMMHICVKTYVDEACENFSTHRPFLDRMLRARPGISEAVIVADIQEFFRQNQGKMYQLRRAVAIATEHIQEGLLEQSPKTVRKTRWILLGLFLAVQLIPFGTIGYCAAKNLDKGRYEGKDQNDELYY